MAKSEAKPCGSGRRKDAVIKIILIHDNEKIFIEIEIESFKVFRKLDLNKFFSLRFFF